MLSKIPLEVEALWAPPVGTGAWYPAQRLVVTAPFGPLQLLHVHLRPALDRGSWLRGFVTTPPVRRKEIAAHWRHLDPTLPTVVAGDFSLRTAAAGECAAGERAPADRRVEDLDRMGGSHILAALPQQHLDLQRATGVGADQ